MTCDDMRPVLKLKDLVSLFNDKSGYTVIKTRRGSIYARVKTNLLSNGNYNSVINAEVLSFDLDEGELCVKVNY